MSSNKTSSDGLDRAIDNDSQKTDQGPPRDQDLEKNEASVEKDVAFLVKFEDGEAINPRNWSNAYKAWITLQLGFLAYGLMDHNRGL